jgi:hypothetical protein
MKAGGIAFRLVVKSSEKVEEDSEIAQQELRQVG